MIHEFSKIKKGGSFCSSLCCSTLLNPAPTIDEVKGSMILYSTRKQLTQVPSYDSTWSEREAGRKRKKQNKTRARKCYSNMHQEFSE